MKKEAKINKHTKKVEKCVKIDFVERVFDSSLERGTPCKAQSEHKEGVQEGKQGSHSLRIR